MLLSMLMYVPPRPEYVRHQPLLRVLLRVAATPIKFLSPRLLSPRLLVRIPRIHSGDRLVLPGLLPRLYVTRHQRGQPDRRAVTRVELSQRRGQVGGTGAHPNTEKSPKVLLALGAFWALLDRTSQVADDPVGVFKLRVVINVVSVGCLGMLCRR